MRDDVVEDRPWSAIERDHDPLQLILDRQCGVIARWQALGLMTEKALRHKIASGRWRSVHRGVFLGYGGTLTDAQRWWIAVLAVKPAAQDLTMDGQPALLAGITALQAPACGASGRTASTSSSRTAAGLRCPRRDIAPDHRPSERRQATG